MQGYGKKVDRPVYVESTKTTWVGHHLENAVTVEGAYIVDASEFVYVGSKIVVNGESDPDVQAPCSRGVGVLDMLGSL